MDFKEIRCKNVNVVKLDQYKGQWWL